MAEKRSDDLENVLAAASGLLKAVGDLVANQAHRANTYVALLQEELTKEAERLERETSAGRLDLEEAPTFWEALRYTSQRAKERMDDPEEKESSEDTFIAFWDILQNGESCGGCTGGLVDDPTEEDINNGDKVADADSTAGPTKADDPIPAHADWEDRVFLGPHSLPLGMSGGNAHILWNMARSHLTVVGQPRGGKTNFLGNIIAGALDNGLDVYGVEGRHSLFSPFLSKVVSVALDSQDVDDLLSDLADLDADDEAVLVVDNLDSLTNEQKANLGNLLTNGPRGLHIVVSNDSLETVPTVYLAVTPVVVVGEPREWDAQWLTDQGAVVPARIPGRATYVGPNIGSFGFQSFWGGRR